MAKISDLPAATSIVDGTEVVPIVQSGITKNSTLSIIKTWFDTLYTKITTLAASSGSSLVGFIQSGTGAVATTVQAQFRDESVRANNFAGVDPTGTTDSYAGLVLAIAATPEGGSLILNGYYKCSAQLSITKTLTIQGTDSRTGNVPSPSLSKSSIYFYNDTHGICPTGVVVTFRSLIITGIGVNVSTNYGIHSTGVNNGVILEAGCVVQSFNRNVNLVGGFYNKLSKSTLCYGNIDLVADGCYNVVAEALTTGTQNATHGVNIELLNGSSMTMLGGSIESFGGTNSFGAALYSGSSLTCIGTYIEGNTTTKDGWNFNLSTGTSLTTIGCHVYLTGCAKHISTEGGAIAGTRVYSRNTRFVYPTDTSTVNVYTFVKADATGDWDVSGDYWDTAAGVNVQYIASSSLPVTYGTGNYNIKYPATHTLYGKNILSTPVGETGTWTPVLSSSGTPPTVSGYTNQVGTYTKIGNRVSITCNIRATLSAAGTGTPTITGLPFSAVANLQGVALGLVGILTAPTAANNYVSGTTVLLSGTYNTTAGAYLTFSAQYEV